MLTELKLETNRHGMARNVQVRPRLLDYSRAPSRLVVDSLSSSSFLSFFFWNRVEPSSLFRQPTIDLVSLGFFFFYPVLPSFRSLVARSPLRIIQSTNLSSFTQIYLVLSSLTKFYLVLPSFSKSYRVLPGFT